MHYPLRRARGATLAAFFCLGVMLAPSPSSADDKARTLSLTGTGVAKARPDRAHITTGVVSESGTAQRALAANTSAVTQIIAELKTQGLEPKHIQTTNISVQPKYKRAKDSRQSIIVGYRVVNSVRLTIINLEKLGVILDKIVSLGSNQIGSIAFSIAETDALTDAARKDAMADALRKAKLYVEAAGAKLGPVMTISEHVANPAPRPVFARAAVSEAKAAVPIEAGEQSLQVRVNVTWELK